MTLTQWTDGDLIQGRMVLPRRVEVRLPPLDELIRLWSVVEPMLRKSTQRTKCYEPIDLLRLAMAGQIGIWVCEVDGKPVASMVTKIEQYPRARVLEMLFCGGSRMKEWLPDAIRTMDHYARQTECQHIASIGRPGWARAWGGELTGDVIVVRRPPGKRVT
jgi:hypothetical protein